MNFNQAKPTSVNVDHLGIEYSIDFQEKTAAVINLKKNKLKIIIPHFINCESHEYTISKISEYAFQNAIFLKSIEFAADSEIKTIETCAFSGCSIESISIPSSIVHLKEGWCANLAKLTKISVMPGNHLYQLYNKQFILKKSKPEKENPDILVFSVRDIQTATIPDFIEEIDSFAFEKCRKLRQVTFSKNSKLRIISKSGFSEALIESILIPSSVTKISEFAFTNCIHLTKIDFQLNSMLQTIENDAFSGSTIESISIPHQVSKIGEGAFSECGYLKKIEIPTNSELQIIERNTFFRTSIESITIPPQITKICKSAFSNCYLLKNVDFAQNSKLQTIEIDAFSCSSIRCISFPPHLRQLDECVFCYCNKLQIVEFDENSEIDFFDKDTFKHCINPIVMIPVKLNNYFNSNTLNYSIADIFGYD